MSLGRSRAPAARPPPEDTAVAKQKHFLCSMSAVGLTWSALGVGVVFQSWKCPFTVAGCYSNTAGKQLWCSNNGNYSDKCVFWHTASPRKRPTGTNSSGRMSSIFSVIAHLKGESGSSARCDWRKLWAVSLMFPGRTSNLSAGIRNVNSTNLQCPVLFSSVLSPLRRIWPHLGSRYTWKICKASCCRWLQTGKNKTSLITLFLVRVRACHEALVSPYSENTLLPSVVDILHPSPRHHRLWGRQCDTPSLHSGHWPPSEAEPFPPGKTQTVSEHRHWTARASGHLEQEKPMTRASSCLVHLKTTFEGHFVRVATGNSQLMLTRRVPITGDQ